MENKIMETIVVRRSTRKYLPEVPAWEKIEEVIRNTTEKNQSKVDWTKAWSTKYPVLKEYQQVVDIPKYAKAIRGLFDELQKTYGYNELDAMLVLKDILAHEYMDHKKG